MTAMTTLSSASMSSNKRSGKKPFRYAYDRVSNNRTASIKRT